MPFTSEQRRWAPTLGIFIDDKYIEPRRAKRFRDHLAKQDAPSVEKLGIRADGTVAEPKAKVKPKKYDAPWRFTGKEESE